MTSLVISLGSNLGEKNNHLIEATDLLQQSFGQFLSSNIYASDAVDYTNQPSFLNVLLEFKLSNSNLTPTQTLEITQKTENKMGRKRTIPKGPRNIDIDILFYGLMKLNSTNLDLPHPRLFQRSFIVEPLKELPFYQKIKKYFQFTSLFENTCSIDYQATKVFQEAHDLSFS